MFWQDFGIIVIPCLILFLIGLFGAKGTPLTVIRKPVVLLKLPVSLAFKKPGTSSKAPYVLLCIVSAFVGIAWVHLGSIGQAFYPNRGNVGKSSLANKENAIALCTDALKNNYQCPIIIDNKNKIKIPFSSRDYILSRVIGKCNFNKEKIIPVKNKILYFECQVRRDEIEYIKLKTP